MFSIKHIQIHIKSYEIMQNLLQFLYFYVIIFIYFFRGVFMSDINTDSWIGINEAADYLGVTKDTIRNWIKKSEMPAHKIGKLWKFKRSELDAWVKSGKSAIE